MADTITTTTTAPAPAASPPSLGQVAINEIGLISLIKFVPLLDTFESDLAAAGGVAADEAAFVKFEAAIALEFPDWANTEISAVSSITKAYLDKKFAAAEAKLNPPPPLLAGTSAPDASGSVLTTAPVAAAAPAVSPIPSLVAAAIARLTGS